MPKSEVKKEIWYMNIKISVPDWAKFIAADKTGRVWVYEEKPYTKRWYNLGYVAKYNSKYECVGKLPFARLVLPSIKEIK